MFISALLAHIFAVMSPGPDFLVVLQTALSNGRKSAIGVALGLGIGILVHVAYSIAGIAIIISQSIILFSFIKVLGALYLIYLGISSLRSRGSKIEIKNTKTEKPMGFVAAVQKGFLTNVLNPKATLFFLGLFTLIISPDTSFGVQVLLGVIMAINTSLWFILVGLCFSSQKVRSQYSRFGIWMDRVFGAILTLVGVKVLTSTN